MPNNLVYIIMDSCRFDSYARAKTPNMDRIGAGESRWSYASWTAPSHHSIFLGQVAHKAPTSVLASEVYKSEYALWVDRLDIPDLSFKSFIPELSLSKMLKSQGYRTVGRVSMPVLNPFTPFSRYFDDYQLMADHNDFKSMVDAVEFSAEQPSYFFLNLGETHYPYMLKDNSLPRISGIHGVIKGMDEALRRTSDDDTAEPEFFRPREMMMLHEQQVRCVEYVDELLGELLAKCPRQTHVIVAADHGDCFGEGNFFGHGPVMHEAVFRVPFLEGIRP